ncbi:HIT domain-containing protein [Buchnera aphidicola (Formosaphis micheliae)]|uniref:HIT domain-containing protein n=1 Tax=Buchnera aphidicola TaxID=9 RepID=UPI0031B85FA5
MEKNNIFEKIISRQIKSDIIFQDKRVTAFKDIRPKYPVHILIVPNTKIVSSNEINENNKYILTDIFFTAINIAKKMGIHNSGYRLILNCNNHGRQEIPHLHVHLIGGELLKNI